MLKQFVVEYVVHGEAQEGPHIQYQVEALVEGALLLLLLQQQEFPYYLLDVLESDVVDIVPGKYELQGVGEHPKYAKSIGHTEELQNEILQLGQSDLVVAHDQEVGIVPEQVDRRYRQILILCLKDNVPHSLDK